MVSLLEAVSLKSPSLFLMVPSESFTTLATSLTERLKLWSREATSRAGMKFDTFYKGVTPHHITMYVDLDVGSVQISSKHT